MGSVACSESFCGLVLRGVIQGTAVVATGAAAGVPIYLIEFVGPLPRLRKGFESIVLSSLMRT